MVNFKCNLASPARPFHHVWEYMVGSGHAPLALRADWQRQMAQCHRDLGVRYARFHAILSDRMGTLICQNNELLYSFFNSDQIIDFLLSIGMKPFIELSFMPETLASGQKYVFHYQANVTPPEDYGKWGNLMSRLVRHWVNRYGLDEVCQWYFEVWNEPNLEAFWTGSQHDYFKLYQHTVSAIKAVDANLQVGGPATAQGKWIEPFLSYCQKRDLPVDFISTHYYPTDALGSANEDTVTQLEHVSLDVMTKQASIVREQAGKHDVYYTEWSTSSNPRDHLHDEAFGAAFATRILMGVQELVQGYSYWTFSDIFEENYFPSRPYQGGFGLLNLYGIPKPAYRAFQILHRLGDELLDVEGKHETAAAWTIRKNQSVTFILINQAMPRHPIKTELVTLSLDNASSVQTAYCERIDEQHVNPRQAWSDLGEPEYLNERQVETIEAVSTLTKEPLSWKSDNGTIRLTVDLAPQSLTAITVELSNG